VIRKQQIPAEGEHSEYR